MCVCVCVCVLAWVWVRTWVRVCAVCVQGVRDGFSGVWPFSTACGAAHWNPRAVPVTPPLPPPRPPSPLPAVSVLALVVPQLYSLMDSDKSGAVEVDEFVRTFADIVDPTFRRWIAVSTGHSPSACDSPDSFRECLVALFAKTDVNHDGSLSVLEFKGMFRVRASVCVHGHVQPCGTAMFVPEVVHCVAGGGGGWFSRPGCVGVSGTPPLSPVFFHVLPGRAPLNYRCCRCRLAPQTMCEDVLQSHEVQTAVPADLDE